MNFILHLPVAKRSGIEATSNKGCHRSLLIGGVIHQKVLRSISYLLIWLRFSFPRLSAIMYSVTLHSNSKLGLSKNAENTVQVQRQYTEQLLR